MRLSHHARERLAQRAPRASIAHAIRVPPRIMSRILDGYQPQPKRRPGKRRHVYKPKRRQASSEYHATPTAVFVVQRRVVVTVYELGEEQLAALVWWALTGCVV